jgi:poly(3-hydroxybutyrate) depolymerase
MRGPRVAGTEQAIYVAIDIPADMARQDCYDDQSGPASQEWEAFDLFHSVVDAKYCVDNDNVFVAGYSTGGNLANMWGCYFAGDGRGATPRRFAPKYHLHGQAVVAGVEPDNNPPCNGPVAAIWIHDQQDSAPYSGDRSALMRVLRMNGCVGSPTAPWHPEITGAGICLQYTACPPRYPVVFCTTCGFGHGAQAERAIPAFKLLFDEASGVVPGADAGSD